MPKCFINFADCTNITKKFTFLEAIGGFLIVARLLPSPDESLQYIVCMLHVLYQTIGRGPR